MIREVTIGDKKVPMLAVASVNVYYKRIFREDALEMLSGDDSITVASRVDFIQRMGFIMAKLAESKQAGKREIMQLNEDDYIEWLDDFDNGALIEATGEISALYMGQQAPTSKAKNG